MKNWFFILFHLILCCFDKFNRKKFRKISGTHTLGDRLIKSINPTPMAWQVFQTSSHMFGVTSGGAFSCCSPSRPSPSRTMSSRHFSAALETSSSPDMLPRWMWWRSPCHTAWDCSKRHEKNIKFENFSKKSKKSDLLSRVTILKCPRTVFATCGSTKLHVSAHCFFAVSREWWMTTLSSSSPMRSSDADMQYFSKHFNSV